MPLKLVLQFISLLWLANASAEPSLAKPGCRDKCGDVNISYPFGIGPGCFIDKWFEVTCNNSFNPPIPFLNAGNLEVLSMSLSYPQVQVNSPVVASCSGSVEMTTLTIDLEGSPFFFSLDNRFVAMGYDNLAFISQHSDVMAACISINPPTNLYDSNNYCSNPIPSSLQIFNVTMTSTGFKNVKRGCKYAFLVMDGWMESADGRLVSMDSWQNVSSVPVTLDWGFAEGTYNCSTNAISWNKTTGYICNCKDGYEGNPYLAEGCQDINECENGDNPCGQEICINTPGSYYCPCVRGYDGDATVCKNATTASDGSPPQPSANVLGLGMGLGLGEVCLLLGTLCVLWLYQALKKRMNKKIKQKFFKRNGGLLLKQQISSEDGIVEKTKIFIAEDLDKATDHYNENRILGQGGQGTVYKGMLQDGRIVAIKKSRIVDEGQIEQFINEVVILSQTNHRNVVKLLGCCLETEVPLLVYEFISNGTLFYHIHDQSEEFPISWVNCLRIATEVAGALAYLHSAASIPIYHRDIKSTNILLDEKYNAKVSDFGISRSVATDKTHLTTTVQGTFGYFDPEYFQSSQFTEKSDVYSFGVVLVELLTGEKPISSTRSEEERNLAMHFISSINENRLFEVLNAQIVKEGTKEALEAVSSLAKRCLKLNGKSRPTMKEVAMELEEVRKSQGHLPIQQNYEEECFTTEPSGPLDSKSSSTTYKSFNFGEQYHSAISRSKTTV